MVESSLLMVQHITEESNIIVSQVFEELDLTLESVWRMETGQGRRHHAKVTITKYY